MQMDGAIAELITFYNRGGGYVFALQLVVTALLAVVLSQGCWNLCSQGWTIIPVQGSFGWPIVGETLSIVRCNSNYPLESWFNDRAKRFGTIFKTSLFLSPSICVTTPEDVKYVLDDPDGVLSGGAPWALARIFGRGSVVALDGKDHKDMHRLLADSLLMPELKRKVPEMDKLMTKIMSTWSGKTIDLITALQDMILRFMTLNFFGIPWEDELADQIVALLTPAIMGITSIPIYFPGTNFYKARNARRKLNELLMPIIRELRNSQTEGSKYAKLEKFPYQSLLQHEQNGEKMSDVRVCDTLVGTILAGIHSPTNTITLTLKYLAENPSISKKVQTETDQLRKKKESTGETVFAASDLKDLKYTLQVYSEILRICNIAPGGGRTTTREINYKGYVIPKGWKVLAPVSTIHMNPEIYPEPTKFDPDRFEIPPNPRVYLPFGRGSRACVGRDVTKLLVAMALYHLTTDFSLDIVNPGGEIKCIPITRMTGKFEVALKRRTE